MCSDCWKTSFKSKTVQKESFRPPFSKGGRFQRQSLWPPIAMGGTLLFAPRARTKRKKRSHELMYQFMTCRPAADAVIKLAWWRAHVILLAKWRVRIFQAFIHSSFASANNTSLCNLLGHTLFFDRLNTLVFQQVCFFAPSRITFFVLCSNNLDWIIFSRNGAGRRAARQAKPAPLLQVFFPKRIVVIYEGIRQ